MDSFEYRAKSNVKAAQWREDNLDEFKQLLEGVIDGVIDGDEEGPFVYMAYIEPYFIRSLGNCGGYYMLKVGSCGGPELDPGRWLVIYEDGEMETMDDEQFHKMFEKVN